MFRKLFQMQTVNGESSFDKMNASDTDVTQIIFRELTDYLIGRANNTLEFDCIPHISNTLPVTMTDMDGIVVIPPLDMRTGTDLEINDINNSNLRYEILYSRSL